MPMPTDPAEYVARIKKQRYLENLSYQCNQDADERMKRGMERHRHNQEVIDRICLIRQGIPRDEAIRIAAKWAKEEA